MPRPWTERTSEKRYVIDGDCGNIKTVSPYIASQVTACRGNGRGIRKRRTLQDEDEDDKSMILPQLRSEHILSPIRLLHRGFGLGEPS